MTKINNLNLNKLCCRGAWLECNLQIKFSIWNNHQVIGILENFPKGSTYKKIEKEKKAYLSSVSPTEKSISFLLSAQGLLRSYSTSSNGDPNMQFNIQDTYIIKETWTFLKILHIKTYRKNKKIYINDRLQSRQYVSSMLHEFIELNNGATATSLLLEEDLQFP